MSRLRNSLIVVALLLATFSSPLHSQNATNHVEQSRRGDGRGEWRGRPRGSPVEFFRELLVMPQSDREEYLSRREPDDRRRLESKLEEYTNLSADERELRLRATELHWYLLPLMRMDPTNRTERLAQVPADMRGPVEERLQTWDILPPPLKEELLDNERTLRGFAQTEKVTPAQLDKMLRDIPPSRRKEMEERTKRWQAKSDEERRALFQQFGMFFDLTSQEKEKALKTLSEAERKQMEKTLADFGKLPREQRDECINAFQKFAGMSLPQREFFLRNAALWQAMSPEERQIWRELVSQVPNWPMPPGLAAAPR